MLKIIIITTSTGILMKIFIMMKSMIIPTRSHNYRYMHTVIGVCEYVNELG